MDDDRFDVPGRRPPPSEALSAIACLAFALVFAWLWQGDRRVLWALGVAFFGGLFLLFAYPWVWPPTETRFDSEGIHDWSFSLKRRCIPWSSVHSASIRQNGLQETYLSVVIPKSLGLAHPHDNDWDPDSSTHSRAFALEGGRFAEGDLRSFLTRMLETRFQSLP